MLVVALVTIGAVLVLRAPWAGRSEKPHPDGPVTTLPAGRITGADLHRVRFPIAFRGYRTEEVDALLDRLAAQLDEHAEPRGGTYPAAAPWVEPRG